MAQSTAQLADLLLINVIHIELIERYMSDSFEVYNCVEQRDSWLKSILVQLVHGCGTDLPKLQKFTSRGFKAHTREQTEGSALRTPSVNRLLDQAPQGRRCRLPLGVAGEQICPSMVQRRCADIAAGLSVNVSRAGWANR